MKNLIIILILAIFIPQVTAQVGSDCLTDPINAEVHDLVHNPEYFPAGPRSDRDNDGLSDDQEQTGIDCDGDGLFNIDDPDSDNDGILDGADRCVCFYDPSNSCTRKLIPFVHGFQGDRNSWAPVVSWVDEEFGNKANARAILHGDITTSLNDAANAIAQEISDFVVDKQDPENRAVLKNNFVVAHSMGGMAMRNIEHFFASEFDPSIGTPYDGLITLGTGHLGVHAADVQVFDIEKYEVVANEACNKLLAPRIQDAVTNLTGGIVSSIGMLNPDKLCDKVDGIILDGAELFFSNNITQDLTTVAAQSWGTQSTSHNINIVGIETDDTEVVYTQRDEDGNVITSGTTVVHNTLTPRFFGNYFESAVNMGLWGGGATDDVGLSRFATMFTDLQSNYDQAAQDERDNLLLALINPAFLISARNFAMVKNSYGEALEFAPKIDVLWKSLIGASRLTTEQVGCNYYKYDWTTGLCDHFIGFSEDCHPTFPYDCVEPKLVIDLITEPSDGFVVLSSQEAMPNMSEDPRRMVGSSHFQMRNDENLKDELEGIFIQGTSGTFFKLKE